LLQPSGGSTPGGHAYWRLFITATNSTDGFFCNIAEINFKESAGGANEATGGTATAGSDFGGANVPSAAFDGNAATFWSTAGSTNPDWIAYQMVFAKDIAYATIQAGSTAGRAARAPKDFQVQYSDDGSSWTTDHTITGQVAWGIGEIRAFSW
jgi:hypothetical protein